jgi:acetyl-CoA carboxylase carboxyl transferase subunit beta
MLFHRELADNLNVCSNCDHHMAITPRERFAALFDGGMFTEVKVPEPVVDPLHFRDQKKYTDRIKAAQKSSGEKDAMLVAEGEIAAPDRRRRAGFHLHGRFDGHVCRQCHHRCGRTRGETQAAACAFCASGGARMQEGILSLMQMPRTTVAVQMLKEAGLPYIVVLTHPTTGGTASYAMLGDVQIAEPNAQICFAGRGSSNRPSAKSCPRASSARNTCWTTACWTASSTARRCGGTGDAGPHADRPAPGDQGRPARAGGTQGRGGA